MILKQQEEETMSGTGRRPLAELGTNRLIYDKMPDGNAAEYNRIFDVTDEVFGTNKIRYDYAERYMFQYKDAMRNFEMVQNRYDYVITPLAYDAPPFRKDPTARYPQQLRKLAEFPNTEKLLRVAEADCMRARRIVGDLIYSLPNEKMRMVMTAHYLCFADWKTISCVYGHQDRWAKDVHTNAMGLIDQLLCEPEPAEADLVGDFEIEDMMFQWKTDEFEWKVWEKDKHDRMRKKEELRLMVGLAPVIPERTPREFSKT